MPAPKARRRIIAAANSLLEERRYRDLGIEEVMREAGLSRTVFYRHFSGLADIVLALVDEMLEQVVQEAELGDPRDPEVMRRQLRIAVETYRAHGPLLLAFEEASHHDDAAERARREMFDRGVAVTCALLERGIAEGHTPPLEVREVSRALTAMNVGYLLELLREGDALDVEAAVATLWTVWTRTTWPEAADSAEARSG